MENNKIIIILLAVIIALLVILGAMFLMSNHTTDDSLNATDETPETTDVPDTISVELTEFDTKTIETAGEYTVEAEKWMGSSVGGFEVSLSKNGQLMDRDSYLSRAYFNDGSGWKWSNWDTGETSGATLHKYPVSSGVEISEVEVKIN